MEISESHSKISLKVLRTFLWKLFQWFLKEFLEKFFRRILQKFPQDFFLEIAFLQIFWKDLFGVLLQRFQHIFSTNCTQNYRKNSWRILEKIIEQKPWSIVWFPHDDAFADFWKKFLKIFRRCSYIAISKVIPGRILG